MLVDDHPAADEQDQDEADLGEVLHQRGEAGAQVGVLDVGPLHPVGGRGQLPQLLLLGGEAAHHTHAVHVLVDDGRHLGQAGLDDPRDREQGLPHLDAHDVDERHRRHGDEGQRHADGEHEAEGDDRDGALHEDHGREREVHLHGADVGVGPRDQLSGLHPVVEGEGHPREVLVEDVAQVELDGVGDLEEVRARDVAEDPGEQPQHGDQLDVVVERLRLVDERVRDAVLEDLGDPHLNDEPEEREDERAEELHLVRQHDRRGPLDPLLRPVGVDASPWARRSGS